MASDVSRLRLAFCLEDPAVLLLISAFSSVVISSTLSDIAGGAISATSSLTSEELETEASL